jgi:hypothetical protein
LGAATMTDPSSAKGVGADGEAIGVGRGWEVGTVVNGGRARARGMLEGWQSALRWPKEPQRAQRMGSLQSATLWSLERQRKQRSLSDALLIGKVATWFKEAEAEC